VSPVSPSSGKADTIPGSPVQPADRKSLVGRRLGDFELAGPLASGGGGVVYAARQVTLAREAVVKVIEPGAAGTAARFLREAQLASRLDHPFAAHVYAFGAEPDILWIAFERVQGTPFDQLLARRGPLPLARLVPFFDRLCQVVHTAHEQGIVHRDIKPANVIVVSRAGHLLPKLLDLGVARLVGQPEMATEDLDRSEIEDAARLELTSVGDQLGTPYYMAPEQWRTPAEVDARADIYALGVLFYEALTGQRPFEGDSVLAVARAHARRPLPPLADERLHAVLARATSKRAVDRHDTALALSAAIREAAALPDDLAELPRLPPDLLEWTRLDAPRPIADAVMALDGARSESAALAAAVELGRTAAHLAGVVSLCAARVVGLGDEGRTVASALEGDPAPAAWWSLARAVTRPWAAQPELFPVPGLVHICWHRDGTAADAAAWAALEALREGPSFGSALEAVTAILRAVSPLSELRLALARAGDLEDWSGARGGIRPLLASREPIAPGNLVLLGPDGALHLVLSPLVQAAAPTPGAPDEVFLLAGRGRSAARLRSRPIGFERSDPELGPLLARELDLDVFSPGATGGDERSPYAGLAPFTAADVDRFVGREAEAEAMANRILVTRFVAVVGASGAGKSSFVQAGVLPLLPADWRSVVVRPGISPIGNLVAALDQPDDGDLAAAIRRAAGERPLVLVVDQFEEVLTLTHDRAESERYAAALVDAAGDRVRVVVTLRDDFLMRVGSLPALRDRLARELELLTTPARDQLCRILREPARRAGYELEDGLVEEMVDAVSDQPGALALLSFTASRLWELRDRRARRLMRKAYLALGAVGGALAQHAEETLSAIAAADQPIVREAFRHLVTSEGTRAVMRRDELTQLLPGGERVIEHLIGARLLVGSEAPGGEQVEIIHEALLSSWPRLVGWRLEDAESVRLRDQLRGAARQWHERGRQRGLLWRGDALVELRSWRRRFSPNLTANEAAFAQASEAAEARASRARRAILATALLSLSIAVVVFYRMNTRAEEAATRAERSAAEVRSQIAATRIEQGRKEWLEGRPLQAAAFLAAGQGDRPAPRWLQVMIDVALEGVRAQELLLEHPARVGAVRLVGDRIVTGDRGGAVRIWDLTGRLVATRTVSGSIAQIAPLSDGILVRTHDGARAAIIGLDGGLRREIGLEGNEVISAIAVGDAGLWIGGARGQLALLDRSGAVETRTVGPDGAVVHLAPVAGGGVLAVGDRDQAVYWASGRRTLLTGLAGGARGVLLPGARAAVASMDGGVRLYDLARGGPPTAILRGHHQPVPLVAASPDGGMIASAGFDGRLLVWRVADGALLAAHVAHGGAIHGLAWRGDRLFSGSHDNGIKIWRPLVGLSGRLDGHQGPVRDLDLSADGEALVSASADRTVRLWTVPPPRARIVPIGARATGVAFAGDRLLISGEDGVRLFDREGRAGDHWPTPPLRAIAVSGSIVAGGGADGRLHWFDGEGRPARPPVAAHEGEVTRLELTPDGRELVSAGDDGALHWWDTGTGARLRSERHESGIWALATGAGGAVWSGGDDRRAVHWVRGREQPAASATMPEAVNVIAPARDGGTVMVGLEDGSSWLYRSNLREQLRALGARGPNVFDGELSPDGALAALTGFDAVLRLHEVEGGRLIAALPLFTDRAWKLAFSPEGDLIAVVSAAGELALVRLPRPTGRPVSDIGCRTPFVIEGSVLRELVRAPGCD
jgi:WD40 repeat protein